MTNSNAASPEAEYIDVYHKHDLLSNQTSSVLIKRIRAPVQIVWSLVRRFNEPQRYKPFVQTCTMEGTELRVGCKRYVNIISGLPATTSIEQLEILDDENHIVSYRVLGGDHRLKNYKAITTLHPILIDGKSATLLLESYVVDVPDGNTKEDTRFFVEALIRCNLKSLADICERISKSNQQ